MGGARVAASGSFAVLSSWFPLFTTLQIESFVFVREFGFLTGMGEPAKR